ncbi:MAG: hypothetical protein E7492_01930 [Ruminococcaceae bacterium]|nr:hypothetical protein [Oscillospiraceae bacterium]
MKNKKLIPITVCLVAMVLIGILGFSKVFENSWQQPKQTDNNLSAEIVDNVTTVFDYPYFVKENGDTNWSDDMISFQQASNIGGEIIKYVYGVTQQSVDNATLEIFDRSFMSSLYRVPFGYNYSFTDKNDVEYMIIIDPYTGQRFYMERKDEKFDNLVYKNKKIDFSEKENLKSIAKQYFELLGVDKDIIGFVGTADISEDGTVTRYLLNITFSDENLGFLTLYITDDNNDIPVMLAFGNDTSAK